jgi:hypothetical protein
MDINVQELRDRLAAGEKFVFIDVREPWEYEEFNLGAQLIPLGNLMNSMWELEGHKNDEIVVHCRSGNAERHGSGAHAGTRVFQRAQPDRWRNAGLERNVSATRNLKNRFHQRL